MAACASCAPTTTRLRRCCPCAGAAACRACACSPSARTAPTAPDEARHAGDAAAPARRPARAAVATTLARAPDPARRPLVATRRGGSAGAHRASGPRLELRPERGLAHRQGQLFERALEDPRHLDLRGAHVPPDLVLGQTLAEAQPQYLAGARVEQRDETLEGRGRLDVLVGPVRHAGGVRRLTCGVEGRRPASARGL